MALPQPTAPDNGAVAVSRDPALKRAVTYLRVSTPSQVKTDYNPEGISIPAQRDAVVRKVGDLGAQVVAEFVEPGRTATSIEKRPIFQEMLAWVKDPDNEVDFVVVYHFNRIFRNSIDAAITKKELQKHGVRVVSTILDMGESPESNLVETIVHAVDQYQSEASGADIRYKMEAKVRKGGTPSRAPIGYLNVRDTSEGRSIGTVIVDDVRAPLVRQAFELYATDEFTIAGLATTMANLGLTTRGGPATLEKPLSKNQIGDLLQNRYYIGFVTFKDEEIPGRHQPIVEPDLFEKVQIILDSRNGSHVRKRIHDHYLKGMLWCWTCHQHGREFRLIRQQSTGRHGGTYSYFFCRGRQEGVCDTRHLWVDEVEQAIVDFYGRTRLPSKFVTEVRSQLAAVVHDAERSTSLRRQQLAAELRKLDKQEERLVDLAADGEIGSRKVKERLRACVARRVELTEELESVDDRLEAGAEFISEAAQLLGRADDLYEQMSDQERKLLNRALFKKIYVREGEVVTAIFNPPFHELATARDLLAPERGLGTSAHL